MSKQNVEHEQNQGKQYTTQNMRKYPLCRTMHKLRQCPAFGRACANLGKINHFKQRHRSTEKSSKLCRQKERSVHGIQFIVMRIMNRVKNTDTYINTVAVKGLNFYSIRLAIVTKLDKSSKHKITEITYKIETGNDANVMPPNIFKILFLKTTVEKLSKNKDKSIVLYIYNKLWIPQLDICSTNIKQKI